MPAGHSDAPDTFDVSLSSPGIAFVSGPEYCSHEAGAGCRLSEDEAQLFRVFLTKPAKDNVTVHISVDDFLNSSAATGIEHSVSGEAQLQVRQCEGPDIGTCTTFRDLRGYSLTLPVGTTAATLQVKAQADSLAEGVQMQDGIRVQQHTIRANFTSTDCAYTDLVRTVPFDVADTTPVGLMIDDLDGELRVSEDCTTADMYTLRLSSQPTAEVMVVISADSEYISFGSTCGGGSEHTVAFTPSNWDQPVNISVWGNENFYDDGEELRTHVVHRAVSHALGYREMPPLQRTIVLDDNDIAGLNILDLPQNVIEATNVSFAMTLATQPRQSPVTVTVSFEYANDDHWSSTAHLDDVDAQSAALCPRLDDAVTCAARTYERSNGVESLCETGDDGCHVTADVLAILNFSGRRPVAEEQLHIEQPVLTFTNQTWDVEQHVTVSILTDSLMEADQDYVLQFEVSGLDLAYDSSIDVNRTLTVTDANSQAVNLQQEGGQALINSSFQFVEDDGGAYFASLSAEPSAGAAVMTIASGSTDVVVLTPTILVSADRWDQPHRVQLVANSARMWTDDGEFYSGEVAHTIHGSVDGIQSPAPVAVTVEDDDTSGIVLSCATTDHECEALHERRAATGAYDWTGVPVLENRQTELAVRLQSKPHGTVSVEVSLGLREAVVTEMALQRDVVCRSLTSLASCLSVPHCTWEDPAAQSGASEEDEDGVENTCGFIFTHDTCAILLELNLYTIEQLEEEMGSDFCTLARDCNYHIAGDTEGDETASCTLDRSGTQETGEAWLAEVRDQVNIVQLEPLTFNESNWDDDSQYITVDVRNVFADTSFMLQYSVESDDGLYSIEEGRALEPGELVLVNSDECGLNVTYADLTLSENDPSPRTYYVRLTSQPVDPQGFVVVRAQQKQVSLHTCTLHFAPRFSSVLSL